MQLRNVSPLGALTVAGVGFVDAGATFDGPDALADQVANFTPAAPAVDVVSTSAPVAAQDGAQS